MTNSLEIKTAVVFNHLVLWPKINSWQNNGSIQAY